MAELKNPKHEKFVQNIVRGLSPTEAYISAGYSRQGAHASAARLLKNPQVCARLAELQKAIAPLVEAAIIKLAVTERLQRLEAIQDRWDALREAKRCFAAEDYEGAMKTGVVCRKVRWIGGKDGREVVEYEINSALIEALNSVEKRAAIETGQEVDRADISLRGGLEAQAEMLRKAFTLEELEVMDAKMEAAKNGHPRVIEAPNPSKGERQPSRNDVRGEGREAAPEGSLREEREDNGLKGVNGTHVNGKESWRE